jgi:hypothetical protein
VYTHVKVFSATKVRDRDELGEKITAWIKEEDPNIKHTEVRLSSDHSFHCLVIVVFYEKK